MPPDDAQLLTLLCSRGLGNEHHIQWHMSMTRALACYHACMAMEGVAMDFVAQRHSKAAYEQGLMHRRVSHYLALTRGRE